MTTNQIELNLRDGLAIDRAESTLAHAIAIVTGDYPEAKQLARHDRDHAFTVAQAVGHEGRKLALAVIGYLDQSRSRLPV